MSKTNKKKNSPNEHQERERKKNKKKKQHRKTSLTGFEPPTDQSEIVKLSTTPRGIRRLLTVEELIFTFYGLSSNSSWVSELSEPILRLEKLYYSIETCKNIKTRLVCGIFLFYISRLQTSTMEQTFPQHVDLPPLH